MYSPHKDFEETAHYIGSAPTGVLTFCDSPPQLGITSLGRPLAAHDEAEGPAKFGSSIWAQATEDQSLASDAGSNGILSSRKSASISSSTVPQLCGHMNDFLETIPLEVQHPWSPEAPMQKSFQRPHQKQKSANRHSTASDISNETSSYFSCASSIASSSTQQFHECNEWYRSAADDRVSSGDLEPERTVQNGIQPDAAACDSDLFQPINILMESFESFGSIASSLKFRSLNHTTTQSPPRVVDNLETENSREFLFIPSSETMDPLDPSERRADRLSGQSFGTLRLEEFDTLLDSVSDLMTSSEEGNAEEGYDMSYTAWLTKTGDDLSIGSGESNKSDDILKPVNAEKGELRLLTKVPNTSADNVHTQSSAVPDALQSGEQNPHEHSRPISIPRVQATRSSASEDSLGLMERVVGMTLQSLKRQASWTDISTLQSEKSHQSDLESYAIAHVSSDAADWSESPLSWEFAEESQVFQTPVFKALTGSTTKGQSTSGATQPAVAAGVDDVEQGQCLESDGSEVECRPAGSGQQSRDPSLTYSAQSNPTFRDRLSLEVTSGSDHSMLQTPMGVMRSVLDDRGLEGDAEASRRSQVQQGCKLSSFYGTLKVNDLPRIGSVRLTDEILKEFEWRLPLRRFTSLSEPPGLNFMQSAKYRILTWYQRIFRSSLPLAKQDVDYVRRSLSMVDEACYCQSHQDIKPIVESYRSCPSANSDLAEDADDECRTPAASVVEEEFGFRDAEDLNHRMRSLPEFQGIDLGLWTSKMIGFATPAKYYAHMARELHDGGISIFTVLSRLLGLEHNLVQELKAELEEDGKELILILPPQRTLADEEWNSKEKVNEWGSSVLSALLQCGINALFFDRGPVSFSSVSEYYTYLSQKLRTEGVDIDCIIPQLEERLGVQHPLMDALENCEQLHANAAPLTCVASPKSNAPSIASLSTHGANQQDCPVSHEQFKERRKARTRLADFVKHKFLKGPKHRRNYSADTDFRNEGLVGEVQDHFVMERKFERDETDEPPVQQKRHSLSLKGIGERLRNRKAHKKNQQSRSRGGSLAIEPARVRNAMEMDRRDECFTRGCVSMDPGYYGPPRNSQAALSTVDRVKQNRPSAAGNHEESRANRTNVSLAAYTAAHDSHQVIKTHQGSRARCRIGEKSKSLGLFVSNLETCPL